MKRFIQIGVALMMVLALFRVPAGAESMAFGDNLYNPGRMKPVDSVLKVKPRQLAPGFSLPAVGGGKVTLAQFMREKNIVISFIPAAWTPVCSDQWPGYNLAKSIFEENDAVLLGISVDNIPTLFAWTRQMGDLWFPVLSDFWPHGEVAASYGVLRSDGMAERALIVIDKSGIIRAVKVSDINVRPDLEWIAKELGKLKKK